MNRTSFAKALGVTTAWKCAQLVMDFLHLITARKEGKAVVTVKPNLVFIVHMQCKGLIQKELLVTVLALRTNNLNMGFRKDKVCGDAVCCLNMVHHFTC